MVLVIGHRGYSAKYPENTIAAFLGAFVHGADGVELDVWLSGDGIPVVIHDPDTTRVSGVHLEVKKSTVNELRRVYLGMGQTIPTLEEVLASIPKGKTLIVEIKDVDAVETVVQLINRYGRVEDAVIVSFLKEALVKTRELSGEIRIGVNIDSLDKLNWSLSKKDELKLFSLNPPIEGLRMFKFMAQTYARMVKSAGLKIYVWTVNDPEEAREWAKHVDGFITDNVEALVKALKYDSS
ncbi:MAG: glycerophosphodiester phosphodiesterase family protein [Candidatus Aenigmatarchaeota archaeon]